MSVYYTPSRVQLLRKIRVDAKELEISLPQHLKVFKRDHTGGLTTEVRAHVLALKKKGNTPFCRVRTTTETGNNADGGNWVPLSSVQLSLDPSSSQLISQLLN